MVLDLKLQSNLTFQEKKGDAPVTIAKDGMISHHIPIVQLLDVAFSGSK